MGVKMPSDCIAPSYEGPAALGVCQSCGHVSYIPDPDVMGSRGHCNGCNSSTEWSA